MDAAIAGAHMHRQGVAFVSYNTRPGGYMRKMLREMMLFHIGGEENPAMRLERARELLRMIAMGRPESDTLEAAVAAHAVELLERTDSALYHDDLCDIYDPVHFHEFAAHAARHDLQYLGEAHPQDAQPRNIAPEAIARVREMAAGDRIAEEQYFDFARTRRFRQTLLCHAGNRLREGSAEGCTAASSAQEKEQGVFVSASGTRMSTVHPGLVQYLRRLMGLWPRSERVTAEDAELARELRRVGMIELHGFEGVARLGGERPSASRFARYQAGRGDARVTTLGHRTIELADDAARKLITLLDGSRERTELAREMDCSMEMLDGALDGLGRHELLTE